jgi:hypothetical protein
MLLLLYTFCCYMLLLLCSIALEAIVAGHHQASKPPSQQDTIKTPTSQARKPRAAESLEAHIAAVDAVIDIKHTQAGPISVRSKPPASAKPAAHMAVPA